MGVSNDVNFNRATTRLRSRREEVGPDAGSTRSPTATGERAQRASPSGAESHPVPVAPASPAAHESPREDARHAAHAYRHPAYTRGFRLLSTQWQMAERARREAREPHVCQNTHATRNSSISELH